MELASLFLGLINLVMLFVVLAKLGKISRQLEIPVVKKMTPELKLKPAKNRIQKSAIISEEDEGKQGNRNQRGNSGRNKGGQRNRDNDSRNNNNGRRRRSKNRYESPGVVMSNHEEGVSEKTESSDNAKPAQAVENKREFSTSRAPAVENKTSVEIPSQNPTTSSRPALAPRGVDRSVEAAPAPVSAPAVEAPAGENAQGENRKIRHGRRNHVKKAPVIED